MDIKYVSKQELHLSDQDFLSLSISQLPSGKIGPSEPALTGVYLHSSFDIADHIFGGCLGRRLDMSKFSQFCVGVGITLPQQSWTDEPSPFHRCLDARLYRCLPFIACGHEGVVHILSVYKLYIFSPVNTVLLSLSLHCEKEVGSD